MYFQIPDVVTAVSAYFFVGIFLELVYIWLRHGKLSTHFDVSDAITSISNGYMQRICFVLYRGVAYSAYVWTYSKARQPSHRHFLNPTLPRSDKPISILVI